MLRETPLRGAFLVEPEPERDERGFSALGFCAETFESHGLRPIIAQRRTTWNARKGTLRGVHYQMRPHGFATLVRCIAGGLFAVVVDLRPASPTWLSSFGVTLTASSRRAIYVPEGFAHGYLTLADETEVSCDTSDSLVPGATRGLRWDDPALRIEWPLLPEVMSERDRSWDDFDPVELGRRVS
jgi:dTDP-4-dehydrorhamnose 3,5-epimerase